MFTEADLLAAIDQHLALTHETGATFGRRIAGDSNLVADLRAGRSPTMRLARKILVAIEREQAASPSSSDAAA